MYFKIYQTAFSYIIYIVPIPRHTFQMWIRRKWFVLLMVHLIYTISNCVEDLSIIGRAPKIDWTMALPKCHPPHIFLDKTNRPNFKYPPPLAKENIFTKTEFGFHSKYNDHTNGKSAITHYELQIPSYRQIRWKPFYRGNTKPIYKFQYQKS